MEKADQKFEELKKLTEPLQEWLMSNYDPMCEIRVDGNNVVVLRKELGLPL